MNHPESSTQHSTQAENSAATSIASLLYTHERDEVDNHGLMEYLQHNEYTHESDGRDPGGLVPLPSHRGSPYQGGQRSASPPNPNVAIPASLSRLASDALSTFTPPAIPAVPSSIDQSVLTSSVDYGERGEMGGKRRKLPHERAGWIDMDKETNGSSAKKRKMKRSEGPGSVPPSGSPSQAVAESSSQGQENTTGHDLNSLQELSRMVTQTQTQEPEGQSVQQNQETSDVAIDPTLASTAQEPSKAPETPSGDSKLSRAEQNKRAQQAFRRRREEHMKRLESEAAQLQNVLKQCAEQDSVIKDLLLSQHSDKIRIAALESLIRQHYPICPIPLLNTEGELNIQDSSAGDEIAPIPIEGRTAEDVERALDTLAMQSREVAKANVKF